MGFEDTLQAGRDFAGRQFVDACTLQKPTGNSTNGSTGVVTATFGAAYYSGPCKVQGGMANAADVGEKYLAMNSPIIHVPISVVGAEQDDLVTITASAHDPDLVGRTFRIQGPTHKTGLTARRLQCVEATD